MIIIIFKYLILTVDVAWAYEILWKHCKKIQWKYGNFTGNMVARTICIHYLIFFFFLTMKAINFEKTEYTKSSEIGKFYFQVDLETYNFFLNYYFDYKLHVGTFFKCFLMKQFIFIIAHVLAKNLYSKIYTKSKHKKISHINFVR